MKYGLWYFSFLQPGLSHSVAVQSLFWEKYATSTRLALHLCAWLTCSLCPHRSPPYLWLPGLQVAVEDPGAPQGSGEDLPGPTGPPDSSRPDPPVMEVGEAGPPSKMSSTSKLPKGTDGSTMPVQGFAGAPGLAQVHEPHFPEVSFYWTLLFSAALF